MSNTFENIGPISVVGNVGMDAELRYTSEGRPVCNFNLAGPREFVKDANGARMQATWYRIVIFDELATYAAEVIKKSMKVAVAGRLQHTVSTRESDGRVFERDEILAEQIDINGTPIVILGVDGEPIEEGATPEMPTAANAQAILDEALGKTPKAAAKA